MKPLVILLSCLIAIIALPTFGQAPGGVKSPGHWIRWEKAPGEKLELRYSRDSSAASVLLTKKQTATSFVNFNPVCPLDSTLAVDLQQRELKGLSAFAVYKTAASREMPVYSILYNDTALITVTNKRKANFSTLHYSSVPEISGVPVRLSTYLGNATRISGRSIRLLLRGKPSVPSLPVAPFEGVVPEIVLYNRVLSTSDRDRVESYLAVKYGISLVEKSYYNSEHEIIWSYPSNSNYSRDIAGIGRDDRSGLLQRKSSSSNDPGFLTIGVDTAMQQTIPDKQFLVWGEAGGAKAWAKREPGKVQTLQKEWKISPTPGFSLTTKIELNTGGIQNVPVNDKACWLLVDCSGTGNYPMNRVDYYCYIYPGKKDYAVFDSIAWDPDRSGADVITFASGDVIIPKLYIDQPFCNPEKTGTMHVGVEGGRAPYSFLVKDEKGNTVKSWTSGSTALQTVPGITRGGYTVRIEDADHHLIDEAVYIQPGDAPKPRLAVSYEVQPSAPLVLDAKPADDKVLYEWYQGGKLISTGATCVIEEPGECLLVTSKDGCPYRHHFTVALSKSDAAEDALQLYVLPNPALRGSEFKIRISAPPGSELKLNVHNSAGARLRSLSLSGSEFYNVPQEVTEAGLYIVSVSDGNTVKSKKVIVN